MSASLSSAPQGREGGSPLFFFFLLLWLPYAALVRRFWFIADDAFISFRYARHLAAGEGLRYNLAEAMPVEGYSNFLWTLLAAGLEWLHADITFWPLVLSFAAGSLLLALLLFSLYHHLGLSLETSVLAVLLLALSPAFAVWSTSGLETMPLALLLFALFASLIFSGENFRLLPTVFLGLALTLLRVEGPFWTLTVFAAAFLVYRSSPTFLRRLALAGALILLCYGIYWGWRYSYYHQPFANTVYAKAEFSWPLLKRGLRYLGWQYLTLLSPLLALAGALSFRHPERKLFALTVGLLIAAHLAFAAAVGGDFMAFGRFLVPALPFHIIFIAWFFEDWRRGSRRRRKLLYPLALAAAVITVLPAFNLHLAPSSLRSRFFFRHRMKVQLTEYEHWVYMKKNTRAWTLEGRALARYAPPGSTYVREPIGAAGYYSKLQIYDLCGLVSPEIAALPVSHLSTPGHDKCQPPSFYLSKQPDLLYSTTAPSCAELHAYFNRLSTRPFRTLYAPDFISLDSAEKDDPRYVFVARRIPENEDPNTAWDKAREHLGRLCPLPP